MLKLHDSRLPKLLAGPTITQQPQTYLNFTMGWYKNDCCKSKNMIFYEPINVETWDHQQNTILEYVLAPRRSEQNKLGSLEM